MCTTGEASSCINRKLVPQGGVENDEPSGKLGIIGSRSCSSKIASIAERTGSLIASRKAILIVGDERESWKPLRAALRPQGPHRRNPSRPLESRS